MGPSEPHLGAVPGGVDHAEDQVKRAHAFMKRHPHVKVTTPRENGSGLFHAVWTDGQPHDGVVTLATHEQLRYLLDYLAARFDMGTSG
jgi:hypothetical protein